MASVGEWAWEEILQENCKRLAEVWMCILEIVNRRHGSANPGQPPRTFGLHNGQARAYRPAGQAVQADHPPHLRNLAQQA
ncbi:hypothetical protein PtA15_16A309 [Puccinia triticina]|uniref:Uncharacterized protein n=1 Tax=Puccinia triticina TaxID=208348 RepID=A0ABY7D4R5_9BASI|nr:uncharacterized protein PtA15_16A309 [Puccinia triticina]WAQ92401.1 hypothetical protein PtA15_16A309 [Puccinia triticina]WAR64139.1 hypothetical protein PtB15_16B299 [Puccinia triticina]